MVDKVFVYQAPWSSSGLKYVSGMIRVNGKRTNFLLLLEKKKRKQENDIGLCKEIALCTFLNQFLIDLKGIVRFYFSDVIKLKDIPMIKAQKDEEFYSFIDTQQVQNAKRKNLVPLKEQRSINTRMIID